jgi:hypothetical protein
MELILYSTDRAELMVNKGQTKLVVNTLMDISSCNIRLLSMKGREAELLHKFAFQIYYFVF